MAVILNPAKELGRRRGASMDFEAARARATAEEQHRPHDAEIRERNSFDFDSLAAKAMVAVKAWSILAPLAAGHLSVPAVASVIMTGIAADLLLGDDDAFAAHKAVSDRRGVKVSTGPDGLTIRRFKIDPVTGEPVLDKRGKPVLHAEDGGPSLVRMAPDGTVSAWWYTDGKLESFNHAPASVVIKNNVVVREVWAENGKRLGGRNDYEMVIGAEKKAAGQGFVANPDGIFVFLHREKGGLAAPSLKPM